jgi:hypothetical protein
MILATVLSSSSPTTVRTAVFAAPSRKDYHLRANCIRDRLQLGAANFGFEEFQIIALHADHGKPRSPGPLSYVATLTNEYLGHSQAPFVI